MHSGRACVQRAHVAACSHASCLFLHVWENEVKIKFTLKYPSHIFVSVFALNPLQHSVQRETPVRVRACVRAHVHWCVFVMTTRFEMGRSGKESERGRPAAAAALFPPSPILPHQRAARPGGARVLPTPTPTTPPPSIKTARLRREGDTRSSEGRRR